jgi:uncharacterized membrane protein YkoI
MNRFKKLLLGLAALAALAMGGSALAGAASSGNDNAAQERSEAAEGPEQGAENEAADTDDVRDEEGGGSLGAALKARVKQAALAHTCGGTVNAMERDSEDGATYEVEVTKIDGSQVDVRLDDQLDVVAVDADGEHEQTGEHEGDD